MNLIDGRKRNVAVQRLADHVDTGHWPSILSKTLEELLWQQTIQTLDEVARLIKDEGADLDRIVAESRALQAGFQNEFLDGRLAVVATQDEFAGPRL